MIYLRNFRPSLKELKVLLHLRLSPKDEEGAYSLGEHILDFRRVLLTFKF